MKYLAKLSHKAANSLFKRTKSYRELCERIELLEHLVIPPLQSGDIVSLRDGALFHVPNHDRDVIQRHMVKLRNYVEFDSLKELTSLIPEHGVVLDIGANIGNHSVYWGKYSKADAIHGFEPVPETFSILERNIALNGLEGRAICHNFGLGKEASRGSIAQFDEGNIGGTKIAADSKGSLAIRALDEWTGTQNLDRIDFIKIDVEGFEIFVIEGGLDTLKRYQPNIFIECFKPRQKPVFAALSSIGYRVAKEFPDYNYLMTCKA
ncbi:FkbM family methyltransferase [uncultured Cohaesibacter sp.]|uniref:FkbM family methyltransferase n=1 Tax=uncultured Cohaesibacter sp. TaxID=1002546 RepID=UPI0029C60206|nr:FkbM family methyltransferase [uncultured Cohaesibacter sp.]